MNLQQFDQKPSEKSAQNYQPIQIGTVTFSNHISIKTINQQLDSIDRRLLYNFEFSMPIYSWNNMVPLIHYISSWEIHNLEIHCNEWFIDTDFHAMNQIYFPNLIKLDVSSCKINNIESLAFLNANFLEEIYLVNNEITNVSKTLTKLRFPNLKKINLNYDFIIDIRIERCKQTDKVIEFCVFHPNEKSPASPDKKLLAKMESSGHNDKLAQMLTQHKVMGYQTMFIPQRKVVRTLMEKSQPKTN